MDDFILYEVKKRIYETLLYSDKKVNAFYKPCRGCGSTKTITDYVIDRLYYEPPKYQAVLLFPTEASINAWRSFANPLFELKFNKAFGGRAIHNYSFNENRLIVATCNYNSEQDIMFTLTTKLAGLGDSELFVTDMCMTLRELNDMDVKESEKSEVNKLVSMTALAMAKFNKTFIEINIV